MIKLNEISKSFNDKKVLDNFSLNVDKGEFVSIIGKSGSGKTTLLNIMGLLEKPDSGSIEICGKLNPKIRDIQKLRRNNLGYIFQNYALLENETVKYNLLLASKYTPNFNKDILEECLHKVELKSDVLNKKIYQLSGGEQQRVSIARTMVKPCDIILADEPTGNLDFENKNIIINIFKQMKKTIICVTHDYDIANSADQIIKL